MQRSNLIVFAALVGGAVHTQAQGLLETITTPEKAVPGINQTLSGAWMLELRRPGTPAGQPPVPNLVIFHPDGTVGASSADGAQTSAHGVWIRVGDRKFVQTMYLFNFNESRAFVSIAKVRINVQLAPDGQTLKGTTEVVVLDRQGKVMATIPGGTYSGIRLTAEKPGDFDAFQMEQ